MQTRGIPLLENNDLGSRGSDSGAAEDLTDLSTGKQEATSPLDTGLIAVTVLPCCHVLSVIPTETISISAL